MWPSWSATQTGGCPPAARFAYALANPVSRNAAGAGGYPFALLNQA